MRFDSIKPYIDCNNYQVNISLRHLEGTIKEFIEEEGLELNPDFQRGHVWTEEQQSKFIEHVLRGGQSGLDIYFNHTHWNGEINTGSYVCVDGLQRLTACLRFMKNELKVFGHFYHEFNGKPDMTFGLILHVNNLKTRKEVLEWYLQMNSGGTVHSDDELTRVKTLLEAERENEE